MLVVCTTNRAWNVDCLVPNSGLSFSTAYCHLRSTRSLAKFGIFGWNFGSKLRTEHTPDQPCPRRTRAAQTPRGGAARRLPAAPPPPPDRSRPPPFFPQSLGRGHTQRKPCRRGRAAAITRGARLSTPDGPGGPITATPWPAAAGRRARNQKKTRRGVPHAPARAPCGGGGATAQQWAATVAAGGPERVAPRAAGPGAQQVMPRPPHPPPPRCPCRPARGAVAAGEGREPLASAAAAGGPPFAGPVGPTGARAHAAAAGRPGWVAASAPCVGRAAARSRSFQ